MAAFHGKYQHIKNENVLELFTKHGLPVEKAKLLNDAKPTLELIVNGDSIKYTEGTISGELIVGKEVEEKLFNKAVKSITKVDGTVITVTSKSEGGEIGIRTYTLTGDQLVVVYKSADPSETPATRTFKKL